MKVCLDGHIGWSLAQIQLTLYRIGYSHFVTISIDYQGTYK